MSSTEPKIDKEMRRYSGPTEHNICWLQVKSYVYRRSVTNRRWAWLRILNLSGEYSSRNTSIRGGRHFNKGRENCRIILSRGSNGSLERTSRTAGNETTPAPIVVAMRLRDCGGIAPHAVVCHKGNVACSLRVSATKPP
jgi:hypothetical protein